MSCDSRIDHGGVGATCNPVIAHTVLKSRLAEWRPRIASVIAAAMPMATEDDIGWAAVEDLSIDAAALLIAGFTSTTAGTAACRSRPIRACFATADGHRRTGDGSMRSRRT